MSVMCQTIRSFSTWHNTVPTFRYEKEYPSTLYILLLRETVTVSFHVWYTAPFHSRPTQLSSRNNDSSFIAKMKSSGRNVIVFYGSQTGTAEEFAGRLAKEATRYGMKVGRRLILLGELDCNNNNNDNK